MKKNRLIFCINIFIIISLHLQCFAQATQNNNEMKDTVENQTVKMTESEMKRLEVLKELGIIEMTADNNGTMTRAEFILAAMIMRGFDKNSTISGNMPFDDVLSDHKSAGAIILAVQMQILDVGDGMLQPEEPIDLNFALQVLVNAMGYKDFAMEKGGYPYGYYTVPVSRKLIGSASVKDKALSKSQAYTILFNALHTEILSKTKYREDVIEYSNSDKTMMNEYMDIYYTKGRLTANHFVSINGDVSVRADEVVIDNAVYKIGDTKAVNFVGNNVEIYYHQDDEEDEDRELIVVQKNNREYLKINAKDITDFNNSTYTYTNENGKSINESFNKDAIIIYNGKQLEANQYSSQLFKPDMGYVELFSDGSTYDVVSIVSDFDCVVSTISINDDLYTFLDKYYETNKLVFNNRDSTVYTYLHDTAGNSITFDKIKKDDVLTITKSIDGKLINIIVSSDSKQGKVTEFSEDGITLEEGSFDFSKKFKDYLTLNKLISIGNYYTFYLNAYGEIASVKAGIEEKCRYGYISEISYKGGVSGKIGFKIFNEDGTFLTKTITNAVFVDGVKYTSGKFNVLAEKFTANGSFVPQLAKITYGEDDQIKSIDTAYMSEKEDDNSMQEVVSVPEKRKVSLLDSGRYGIKYSGYANYFDGGIFVKSDAKVFMIPKGRYGEDKDYVIRGMNGLTSGNRYDIKAYRSRGESKEANVLVCYYFPRYSNAMEDRDQINGAGAATPFYSIGELQTGIIKKITKVIENGEERIRLNMMKLDTHTEVKYDLRWDDMADNLEAGCVIRYYLGITGEISFLELLFNCNTKGKMDNGVYINKNEDNGDFSIRTHRMRPNARNIVCEYDDYNPNQYYANWRLSYFDVVSVDNGFITCTLDNLKENPVPLDNLTSEYRLELFKDVYRYDNEQKKLVEANASEIIGYDVSPDSYTQLLVLAQGMVKIYTAIILD